MVKGVVNDSSHEITKIYHDGREIERVCDIYGNVLYLSSKTVTGAASLSFKNRKESTRNVVGFSVNTSSSDIESINAFVLSELFIVKQNSTSYFGVYLPEPGSYEIILLYTGQTYNFVSDGDVNTYFFINLGYGAVSNRDIDIYVEKQDGQFDFTKVKYAVFDAIYYDDRYDILNEHPVRFDNSIESYIIYGNNLNGVHVGDYDENSGKYMLPISIHGKNLFNVEDFFSSSINVVRGNMRFYEQTQELVVGVLIQAENNDCYTMPYYQIPCKPGQYYTLSWYSDNNNPGLVYIFFYDSDGIKISQVYANNANSKQLTFLVPENAAITKLRLGVANAGSNIAYTNIQLERGQAKTNYISYQDPVIHTVSLDEPLRKIGNELEYIQKRKSVTNGILHRVTQKTSNTAPLTFASTGQALKNYRIYGNTINGESVGDRTGNLFDEEYEDANVHYVPIKVEDGEYTLSTTIPNAGAPGGSPAANIFLLAGNVNSGASTAGNGCWLDNPKTVQSIDGYVTIAYKATESFGERCYPWNNKTMLNSGSEPQPYEPYGYRVPVTVEGKNLLQNTATSRTIGTDEAEPETYPGLTFTVNKNGSVTINGIRKNTSTFFTLGRITTSNEVILCGCPVGGSLNSFVMRAVSTTVSNPPINYDTGNGVRLANEDTYQIDIRIQADFTCDNLTFYPMIRRAEITDDTYEPYHEPVTTNIYLPEQIKMVGDEAEYADYQEQKLHRVRKNLLKITYASSGATTYDGVSISNNDGILTLNGTSNNGSFVNLATAIKLPIGNYILTGGSENLMLRFQKTSAGYGYDDTGAGRNIVCSEEVTSGICSLKLTANYTYNSVKVYPMIRKADIEDDTYEPYIENTELDAELPELQTVEGTNTLSIRTAVQPSQVLVEAMYPNDSYILTPEISTFEDINTITVSTEIPPESISITGKIGPIS